MGGFMLRDSTQRVGTLSPRNLDRYLEEGLIQVDQREITDKSSRDMLSKAIVLFQTGWFMIQCGIRWHEHLVITELELMAFAYTYLTIAIFVLWLHKAQDVDWPIHIDSLDICRSASVHEHKQDPTLVWDSMQELLENTLKHIHNRVQSSIVLKLIDVFAYPLRLMFDIMLQVMGPQFIEPRAQEVPPFYGGDLSINEQVFMALCSGIFAAVFGGVHCLGWSFQFPSQTEQMLWRASSVITTGVPVVFVVYRLVSLAIRKLIGGGGSSESIIVGIPITLLTILYGCARIMLLSLVIVSLRSLPPGALEADSWTKLIPHIR